MCGSSKKHSVTSTLDNLVWTCLVRYLSAKPIFKKWVLVWHYLLSKKEGGVRKPWACFQPLTQLAAWHAVSHLTSLFLLLLLVEQFPSVSCLLCCPSVQFCAFLDRDFHYSSSKPCSWGRRQSKWWLPVQRIANASEEKQSFIYTTVSVCAMALH